MDGSSHITLIGLSFTLLMGILVLFLPRKLATVPLLITACYITIGQKLVVASLDFSAFRIILLFGWTRLILRKELSSLTSNPIDKILILWVVASILTYTLLHQTTGAFINRLGFAFDAIGLYFFFRFSIRSMDDINGLLKALALITVPLALAMLSEKITGKNLFSIFGGVPELTQIRGGVLRCQGPFRHPILAGTFGATLLPLCVPQWYKNARRVAFIGMISATVIVFTCGSSGPLITYLLAILAVFMWHFRNHMRFIRWGLVFGVISLHMVMKAPVWYLPAKVSKVMGGTGWHRSYLIEQTIAHFSEWWLLGAKYTAHWMPYALAINPDKADITNQFIAEAVKGGLLKMMLFITIIVLCFRNLGHALQLSDKQPFHIKITLWSLGTALFAHVVAFVGISYFDQIIVFWYLLLAMISAVPGIVQQPEYSWQRQ